MLLELTEFLIQCRRAANLPTSAFSSAVAPGGAGSPDPLPGPANTLRADLRACQESPRQTHRATAVVEEAASRATKQPVKAAAKPTTQRTARAVVKKMAAKKQPSKGARQ